MSAEFRHPVHGARRTIMRQCPVAYLNDSVQMTALNGRGQRVMSVNVLIHRGQSEVMSCAQVFGIATDVDLAT